MLAQENNVTNELPIEKRKLFSDEEILDIEEKQEVNIFEDLLNILEDNYLELETAKRH